MAENLSAVLPGLFKDRMRAMLGEEAFSSFCEAVFSERAKSLSVNTRRISPDDLTVKSPFALQPVPWYRKGFFYGDTDQPGKHPFHEAGVYYIQEASAMAAGALLSPEPGERVLDLCAAPGGKTLIASLSLGETGLLVANEIHPARARILSTNAERMGMKNVVVTNEPPEKLAQMFPMYFDRILVDAPCSGEGMFRKEPEALRQWSPELVEQCAKRQQEILDHAVSMLAPGGRLVYSTCTFAPAEDEAQILRLIRTYRDLHTLDALALIGNQCADAGGAAYALSLGMERGKAEYLEGPGAAAGTDTDSRDITEEEREAISHTLRLFPHRLSGEGHFAAVLQREGEPAVRRVTELPIRNKPGKYQKKKGLEEAVLLWEAFAREHFTDAGIDRIMDRGTAGSEYTLFGDMLYLKPAGFETDGLKILRPGLHLGVIKKGRFEPSHALALYLQASDYRFVCDLPAGSPQIVAYLRGETLTEDIEGAASGGKDTGSVWILVAADGIPAGFGKYDHGRIKNHYPKGLRKYE